MNTPKTEVYWFDQLLDTCAQIWVDGNNSGCPETLERMTKTHEETMLKVEKLAKEYGVTDIDWPGLYPTFEDAEGYTYYSMTSFLIHGKKAESTSL